MKRWRKALLLLCACWAGAAGATEAWRAPLLREHRLAGRIWDVHAAREVARDELLARLARARIVLLGETHDNEDHHRLQAQIHAALCAGGARPALVMEQFDTEHQDAIDAARSAPGASARSVAAAGKMRSAWNFDSYAPLIAQALSLGTPLIAANLSREAARAVIRDGYAALGPGRATELALEQAWDEDRERSLQHAILEGHCGQVPSALLPGMAAAQRARDAVMADVLLGQAAGAVGIIGRGHARRDFGVPHYLGYRRGGIDVVAIGLVEVEAGRDQASDYATDQAQFDYLWFTPREQRADPCAGL